MSSLLPISVSVCMLEMMIKGFPHTPLLLIERGAKPQRFIPKGFRK